MTNNTEVLRPSQEIEQRLRSCPLGVINDSVQLVIEYKRRAAQVHRFLGASKPSMVAPNAVIPRLKGFK